MPKLPESAVRFSDAQMRDEPDLVAAAVRYARSYVGDWDVMRAAQQLVVQTGTLPVAVARTVANCARSDPRYILAMADEPARFHDSALVDNVVPLRGCPHIPAHWQDGCQTTNPHNIPAEPAFPFQYHPSDPRHLHDFNAAGYCRNRACDYEPEQAHNEHRWGLPKPQRLTRIRFKHRYYWSTHQGAYRTHLLDPRESYAVWTPDGARFQIRGWCHATVSHWTTGNESPAGRTICPGCEKAEARAVAEVTVQVFDLQSNQRV